MCNGVLNACICTVCQNKFPGSFLRGPALCASACKAGKGAGARRLTPGAGNPQETAPRLACQSVHRAASPAGPARPYALSSAGAASRRQAPGARPPARLGRPGKAAFSGRPLDPQAPGPSAPPSRPAGPPRSQPGPRPGRPAPPWPRAPSPPRRPLPLAGGSGPPPWLAAPGVQRRAAACIVREAGGAARASERSRPQKNSENLKIDGARGVC